MTPEHKLEESNNNNQQTPTETYLWKKELTQEQIAYLEFFHRRTHDRTLKIGIHHTAIDLLRKSDSLRIKKKRFSEYNNIENLSLAQSQKKAMQSFTETLEDLPGKISNTTKYIECTHNQDFLMRIMQEFIGTQNTLLRSIYPTFIEPEKSYSKKDETTTYSTDSVIEGIDYAHNPNLKIKKPLAHLHFEEQYRFNRQKNIIERHNKKMTICVLDKDADIILPQQTLPILTTTTNVRVIPLNFSISSEISSNKNSSFLTQCFFNSAVTSINGIPFSFAAINFDSSEQKLLELCYAIYDEFHHLKHKTSSTSAETLREEFFNQYQQDFEQAVNSFVKEQITDNDWQEYVLNNFQPQLANILKDDTFKEITSANRFLTFYDFQLNKGKLTCKERAQFFQINNDQSFISKNHTALFSFEITHTFTENKHSISALNLIMHEPLENILNVKDESTPAYIEDVFPSLSHLFPKTLWQKMSDSYRSICCAFSCCLPREYQQPEEETENTVEIEETSNWKDQAEQQEKNEKILKAAKEKRENDSGTSKNKDEEQQELIASGVTDGVTLNSKQ